MNSGLLTETLELADAFKKAEILNFISTIKV